MSEESKTDMAEMSEVQFEDWLDSQVFEQGSETHLMFNSMWDKMTESMHAQNAMKDAQQPALQQAQEVLSSLRYKT